MVTLDFETRSYADLQKVGAWSYSEDATTDVICACWGIDDEPIQTWWPGKHRYNTMPLDLWDALVNGDHIEAHNVSFEYAIWKNVMGPKYGWAMPHEDAWRDLMAVACYYALPPKLDKLAMVLGYEGKDPDGARLISKYSKLHLKTAKPVIPQEDFERFVAYCYKDVQIEQSLSDYLGDLPEREVPVFLLDQKVNRRGLYLDVKGIEAAARIVDQRAEELASEFRSIVGYNPTQRDKVLTWFNSHGLALENLQAETLEEVLEDGELGQGEVRRALEIRVAINKASTKKLDAMARSASPTTRRAYYQTRYHGAQTGRNTGQGLQPLNLNRGFEKLPPEVLVRDIMRGDAQWLDVCYGDAMDAIAKASRHWIMAAPGNKLLSGDFVSIEALVLACLAGEDWKVDMFRNKEPVYERMGDKIHGLPPGTVTKVSHPGERQDGKTCLGAGTRVLTQRGWLPILQVQINDKLWDGESWVSHGGLVFNGVQLVRTLAGVDITPDHLMLVGPSWVDANAVCFSELLLNRSVATAMENLPSWAQSEARKGECWRSGSSVLAAPASIWWTKIISDAGKPHAAQIAREAKLRNGARITLGMPISAQMAGIAADCSTASRLASHAVTQTPATLTTGSEGSQYTLRGAKARRVAARFFSTSWGYRGGITRLWRWIASMWTKDTAPETYAFTHGARVKSEASAYYKPESLHWKPVFDIANAGPRRRFTILSDRGPLIVHNCELAFGYGGGLNAWLNFDSSGRHSDERIHEIKNAWRNEHPMIVKAWREWESEAIAAVRHPGRVTGYRDIGFEMVDEWLSMILPNGKRIWYFKPELRLTMPPWHRPKEKEECREGRCDCTPRPQLSYMAQKFGRWLRVPTYGGKLTENAVQATSRELLVPSAINAEKRGYSVILTVYDEIVSEVPAGFGSVKEFEEVMLEPLAGLTWASGWPIRVDAWSGERYRK